MATLNGKERAILLNDKLKTLFYSTWIEWFIRWLFGITFIYASYHKIVDPAHFAKIIYGYYLFPEFIINLTAIVLPYLELLCGIALILGIYPRSAMFILESMLFAFIVALSINLIRGHNFDCGCFSFGERGYGYSVLHLLLRDVICFILGLQPLFFTKHRKWCILQGGSILKNIY
ncbi:MAG: DoxX family membrane protein [Deltaproteobacteria bacterium]|nr:DoxX family membrane protein [Deltaproteobacteria bacterium]